MLQTLDFYNNVCMEMCLHNGLTPDNTLVNYLH